MDNRITILNELKEISPLLASIGCELPYAVPAGYFEGLAASILLKINTENRENTENGSLGHLSKIPVYEVPAGYFEGLAGAVMNRVKANTAATPQEARWRSSSAARTRGRR